MSRPETPRTNRPKLVSTVSEVFATLPPARTVSSQSAV